MFLFCFCKQLLTRICGENGGQEGEWGGGEVHISRHSSKSQTAAKNKTMASSRRKGGIRLLQVGSRLSAIGLASPVVAGPWSDAAAPFTPGSHDSHGSHSTHAGPRASVHPFTRPTDTRPRCKLNKPVILELFIDRCRVHLVKFCRIW